MKYLNLLPENIQLWNIEVAALEIFRSWSFASRTGIFRKTGSNLYIENDLQLY